MRRVPVSIRQFPERRVCRAITAQTLINEWRPDRRFLIIIETADEIAELARIHASGIANIAFFTSPELIDRIPSDIPVVCGDAGTLEVNDIVTLNQGRGELLILLRESDLHHAILLTNRCNSHCLMCSQPPTRHDDAWLIDEAMDIARHIKHSPATIGLSGGEPLLLGGALRGVIDTFLSMHPSTRIDVLTNGRLLSDKTLAAKLLDGLTGGQVTWMVPLYGHADFLHDFIVQSHGAFEETVGGLLSLQEYGHPIQLRIVLIEPVLRTLPDLCRFIGHNLPFVREVALMACEPIGYALANRDLCEVDLATWHAELRKSSTTLTQTEIPFLFMNTPLCALPHDLWVHAHQSISDWKRDFPEECDACTVKGACSGLFAWHNQGWRPTAIKAIKEEVLSP